MFTLNSGFFRRAAVSLTGTTVAGSIIFIYVDEGANRSFTFWSNIFPKYIHYRTMQLLNRDLGIVSDEYANSYYDKLHNMYTKPVRELTYKMRGFYLKHAQLMSTQVRFNSQSKLLNINILLG